MNEANRLSLEETVALLEEALEATQDGLLILDLDRQIVRYNRQFLRMFGLTAEALARGGTKAIVDALSDQLEDASQLFPKSQESWLDPSFEVIDTLRFKDGRVYERFIAPHRLGSRVIGHVASYRDITETVRAEHTLEQHRALLEKAQEIARTGSWVVDLDGSNRLSWSAQTHRIFGVPPEEFAGMRDVFFALVHPDDVVALRGADEAAVAGEQPYDIEHRIVRPDGEVRWVQEKADIVRALDGRPVQMVGTVQDITERRQLEEQLRQSQKMEAIGRLAGGIAHDLNNALTVIIGYAELALHALPDAHGARLDVQEIRRAAARAESVTRQLLAFSRKQMLEPRVFSLGDSVENLGRMLERLLGSHITLKTVTPEALPPIYGDPGRIEQAILNIAVNARDAMPQGGCLTLALSVVDIDDRFARAHQPVPVGRYVELLISDTGQGMSAETLMHVFEPFFTTKDIGKGTGLGLSMVYGTVKQSGGYIFIESELGRGSSFKLYFPIVDADKLPVLPVATKEAHPDATILVAEDEAPVRNLVVTALRRQGYQVLHASTGDEALAIANADSRRIDLLLTDASMPGMSGLELAKALIQQRPEIQVMVMSGYTADTLNLTGLGRTVGLLAKPFTPRELQQKIDEALGARRVERPRL